MNKVIGEIRSINGNMLTVDFQGDIMQNEVAYVLKGTKRLKAEVVKISGNTAFMQVFEYTKGVKVGDQVEFSGQLLSVQLGPGILSQVYDGLQNPLEDLAEKFGVFLPVGEELSAVSFEKQWEFTPQSEEKDSVTAGDVLGSVPEGIFQHKIMVPFYLTGQYVLEKIMPKGRYTVQDTIAVLKDEEGKTVEVTMVFEWPVKIPITAYQEKLQPTEALTTKIRILDTMFPIAKRRNLLYTRTIWSGENSSAANYKPACGS